MPWGALDDQFHANPKVMAAGLEAAGLHALAISYCACYLTDGKVPKNWAKSRGGGRVVRVLIHNGLWRETSEGFELNDYLDFNPSRAEVAANRAMKAALGRKGAEKRWGSKSQSDSHSSSHSSSHSNSDGKSNSEPMAPTPSSLEQNRSTDTPMRAKTCPECGPVTLPQGTSLADHRYQTHGVEA